MDGDQVEFGAANPVDRHVGLRIRLRRRQAGFSQQRLAEIIGLTFQQVQKYERGANRVSASKLWDIAEALGVSPAYFFEGLAGDTPWTLPADDLMHAFLSLTEAHDLAEGYLRIRPGPLRRRVLELIGTLAEEAPRR